MKKCFNTVKHFNEILPTLTKCRVRIDSNGIFTSSMLNTYLLNYEVDSNEFIICPLTNNIIKNGAISIPCGCFFSQSQKHRFLEECLICNKKISKIVECKYPI